MLAATRGLFADAGRSYSRHGGRMLAAAVAFSALLSIAPLLYLALGIASVAVGSDAGRASVLEDLTRWIGRESAATILSLLDNTSATPRSGLTSALGGALLLYASTRLFSQIKRALNHMWDVHARSGRGLRGKVWKQVRKRGLALVLVVFVGLLIIAVVTVKTVLAAGAGWLGDSIAGRVFGAGEFAVSLVTTTLMFAALFKVLPDARIAWRDAWRGALVTSVLFQLGTVLIGFYLGHRTLQSLYGPGASLVVLLLWVHYSAQVFFFGAAVTGELARRRGHPIEPDAYGARIVMTEEDDPAPVVSEAART